MGITGPLRRVQRIQSGQPEQSCVGFEQQQFWSLDVGGHTPRVPGEASPRILALVSRIPLCGPPVDPHEFRARPPERMIRCAAMGRPRITALYWIGTAFPIEDAAETMAGETFFGIPAPGSAGSAAQSSATI